MVDLLSSGLAKLEIDLPEGVIHQQLEFLAELLRWNQRVNLTAIRDRAEALEKHLLDSLVMLKYIQRDGHLLDMGSGGGLPGIPLAIACDGLQLTSVDAVGKKINFQKHIRRKFSLGHFRPLHARLEELAQQLDPLQLFDQVVARAFSSFALMCELSAPWLKPGGQLLAMKGPDGRKELAGFADQLEISGFALDRIDAYRLPFSHAERQIIMLQRL